MSNLYYATAQDKNNKQFIIYHNESFSDRLTASQEADRIAKQLELSNVDVRPAGQSEGRTMTKYFKHRKHHNGENPREYYRSI